jgi:hypothetical protein
MQTFARESFASSAKEQPGPWHIGQVLEEWVSQHEKVLQLQDRPERRMPALPLAPEVLIVPGVAGLV